MTKINKTLINNKINAIVIGLVLVSSAVFASQTFKPAYAPASSVSVGIIGGSTLGCTFLPTDADLIINGGCLPTADPAFGVFTFAAIPVVPLGPLTCAGGAACDTLVLNVASPSMVCTTATLTPAEKATIVAAMTGGMKLIIYDSECAPGVGVDYTWLPATLSFTTFNPGALGSAGCADIIEDNTLSSSVAGSLKEIDLGIPPPAPFVCGVGTDPNATPTGLCPTSDACGDANVMIALGTDLCKDIDATTGAVGFPSGTTHAYSKDVGGAGTGMLIYNGFDMDFTTTSTPPAVTNVGGAFPAEPLAKLFLHELEQPWAPSKLLCGTPVVPQGRMTGGGSVTGVNAAPGAGTTVKVTHGFELHCDATAVPNNLEVNWDKGSKFHLESLTTASCTDAAGISEVPPVAGFDTYKGTGTGRYNGVSGATVEWEFTDEGEPGKSDKIVKLKITDASLVVVLDISGLSLTVGNHQAHA